MIGRSDNSIRTWKSKFLETGEILDIKQGNVQKIQRNIHNIQNYRKLRYSTFAYLEGISGVSDLENQVKKYKKNLISFTNFGHPTILNLIIFGLFYFCTFCLIELKKHSLCHLSKFYTFT